MPVMNAQGCRFLRLLNSAILPIKLAIPQPIVKRIPGLTTNEQIRTNEVLCELEGRVLDIGCGSNKLVQLYRSKGGDGVGIDVYRWDGVDRVVQNTADLDYADGSFDTITFVASFNHIPNREAVLMEAHRLLSAEGKIVATNLNPTVSRIWHSLAFWDKDQHERGMAEGEVWGFTKDELLAVLRRRGFSLEKERPFSWGLNRVFVFRKTQL